MATMSAAKGRGAASGKKQKEISAEVSLPSRREFLYYIWGASMALLLGQATAGIIWFSLPRFKEGTFGGIFVFPPDRVPSTQAGVPESEPSGRFHVTNTDSGLLALYAVCTHLGCLPRWETDKFQCPCHGSQFALDGGYITGPAPRPLDRFPMTITFTDGTVMQTNAAGDPVDLRGRSTSEITSIEIDTGSTIRRPNNA